MNRPDVPPSPTDDQRDAAMAYREPEERFDAEDACSTEGSGISHDDIDQNALRVLSRLQRNGFEAYLVGGCVRDLLLGRKPKDFDVATAAHPRQIKRLFRNGRIIGRRFRLVHVVYGDQVIETATFRGDPNSENDAEDDLLITEDNVFGTAEEDAVRRDFTVNGLLYDPSVDVIHDYVGGLQDLEAGVLRTIGDPIVRFAEDPVRILRAIKFATRLGFRIGDETWKAMCELSSDLTRSAPPRVLEEILRLLRSGTALGAFRMMRASGALETLMPEVDRFLGKRDDPDPAAHDRADSYWRLLEALDANIHSGKVPHSSVLLAVCYQRLIERQVQVEFGPQATPQQWLDVASELIEPFSTPARLSRRIVDRAKRIIAHQVRFTQSSSKNRSTGRFVLSEDFKDALHLFGLRLQAWGQGWDVYEGWVARYERMRTLPDEERDQVLGTRRRRRRHRSRRRRGGGNGDDENNNGFAPASEAG